MTCPYPAGQQTTMTRDDTRHLDAPVAALTLSRIPGLGPRMLTALLDQFGTAESVLAQSPSALLAIEGIGKALASRIRTVDISETQDYLARCDRLGVRILLQYDGDYPKPLSTIADPPPVLHCRGTLLAQDDLAIAIVGSRRCSPYGMRHAGRLAGALVRAGFTVVSGLARGIDAAAHRGALEAGGRTLSVLATGVETIYPPEHERLAGDVMAQGALLSELPLDQLPRRGVFPQRNRIISGLCLGVIIVEATRRSGALHTARHAMEQGREVFAVPGPVDSLPSEGCHCLIRDGVTLVRHVDDVLEQLGPLATPAKSKKETTIHHPREVTLNPQESEVLNAITTSATSIDSVVRHTQLGPSRVLSTLTVLEMGRFIRRLPGNMVVRT